MAFDGATREQIDALLANTDWSKTPLGPRERWPKTLVGYVAMVLEMPTPAIVFWGPEQTQIYNAGYAEIMGPRHPRYFGGAYRECWPDTYPTIYPWMRRVLDRGETIQVERAQIPLTRFGWKEEAYFTFTFSPLRDDDGVIQGIFQPVVEVTSSVLADRRASTRRALARATLADGVAALRDDAADLPFLEVYLTGAGETLRLAASTGIDGPTRGELHAKRAIETREAFEIDVDALMDEAPAGALGERVRRALVMPIAHAQNESPRGAVVCGISPVLRFDTAYRELLEEVAHELSAILAFEERERAERVLLERERAAREQAEEASRMKDEFLATMSHELRTPLNAILGWSSLLRSGGQDEATRGRALATIERNARAQARLIEDILDVARIASGKLGLEIRRADLGAVVRAALDVVRPAAEAKSIRLDVDLAGDEALALGGDPDRLQQVVWNLLTNAIRYTPAGGTVRVSAQREGDSVVLAVSDTGVGIPPEHLPFVFERFRQVDSSTTREHGGLGLGLAIVRHIVELHGGNVHAESEGRGKGATISVRLPVQAVIPRAATDGAPSEAAPEGAGRLAGMRVLVVDDHDDSRALVAAVFEQEGARVDTASSAAEAVSAILASPPELLVSDIGMPTEDGYGLMARVRRLPATRGGAVPAIALTAYARTADRERALSAGFQAHVAKPVDPQEIVRVAVSVARRI